MEVLQMQGLPQESPKEEELQAMRGAQAPPSAAAANFLPAMTDLVRQQLSCL